MRLSLVVPSIHLVEASRAPTSRSNTAKPVRTHLEDSELVTQIQNGERDLFSELVRRYQDRLYTQCLRQMGSAEVASELTQDIFIKIFQNIQRFRHDCTVSTWIFKIAVNHCINQKQRQYRRKYNAHEPLEGNNPEHPRELAGKSNVLNDIQSQEWRHHIEMALAKLDPEQREILILRELQELSYDEISDILELPLGTVKSRMHRARTTLSKMLSPFINFDELETK